MIRILKIKFFCARRERKITLDKTILIGYFLNGGNKNTLVEVDGNLILNNSLINAIGKMLLLCI